MMSSSILSMDRKPMFHVTVLSNFARAYDKYRRVYCKGRISESTYPGEFYVLPRAELGVGIAKAERLRAKLGDSGNDLIALEARLPAKALARHPRGGPGLVWPSDDLPIHAVHAISEGSASAGGLEPLLLPMLPEEAMAKSLALHASSFASYGALRPRAVSFLPIAKGCQAACSFCFSETSASVDQRQRRPDWNEVARWIDLASDRGAERAVITGGGEPTLLPSPDLLRLVRACAARFRTVVLITNGYALATARDTAGELLALRDAGLSVLAISRHHWASARNQRLMNLETRTEQVLDTYRGMRDELSGLRVRLVCVLQRDGIASVDDVDDYVAWAAVEGADEVCFKELYVSTSLESVYHARSANQWSAAHQVPLDIVHAWAERGGFPQRAALPWGAPIFEARAAERSIRVAAYTEPSLFWERTHGIARSWNIMSDGTCLASLEDRQSVIPPQMPSRSEDGAAA